MQILRSLTGLLYIGLAAYIWVTKKFVVELSETSAFALGLVMLAYGLFRCYQAYVSYKNNS